jgi:hypothetical protein
LPNAVPVTIENSSSSTRVTVKSHSIPPRRLSICVYAMRPTSRTTRLSHSDSRNAAAPGPASSISHSSTRGSAAAPSSRSKCSAA